MPRLAVLMAVFGAVPGPLSGQRCPEDEAFDLTHFEVVTQSEMARAISLERGKGYDLTASTNGSRLWAYTAFKLVEWARARNPGGPPLYIDPDAYYRAYRDAALSQGDTVPLWVQIAYDYRQRTLIEYRLDRVVDSSRSATVPSDALAVCTWWPESEREDDQLEYEDTQSSPTLLVVNEREVRYYLTRLDEYFMWDDVEGVRGRPTSGVLGALFWLFGTGKVEWSRMALTEEGAQVVRAHASKFGIGKTTTVFIEPDGTGGEVPDDDDGAAEIAAQIQVDVDVRYRSWPF